MIKTAFFFYTVGYLVAWVTAIGIYFILGIKFILDQEGKKRGK